MVARRLLLWRLGRARGVGRLRIPLGARGLTRPHTRTPLFSVPVPLSPSPPSHAPAGGGVVLVLGPNGPQYPNTARHPDAITTHATSPAVTPWYPHQWAQAGLRSCRHTALINGLVQGKPAHYILMRAPYQHATNITYPYYPVPPTSNTPGLCATPLPQQPRCQHVPHPLPRP